MAAISMPSADPGRLEGPPNPERDVQASWRRPSVEQEPLRHKKVALGRESSPTDSAPGDFYLPGQKEGQPLQAASLHELRRDIREETGVENWGAHDLRSTFRSNLARL